MRLAFTIADEKIRSRATIALADAPIGSRVEIKGPVRTVNQNARLWAMLTEIAEQKTWHGLTLSTNDWKLLFMNALGREGRIIPNMDGNGIVQLSHSSSDLNRSEFSDLFEIIHAWAAREGVVFHTNMEAF
jgi:hypothetical protein